jgi:hypothetical protein
MEKLNKIAIFDIDGVLADYPKCFLSWVNDNYNLKYDSIDEMKKTIEISRYEEIKLKYRQCGIKRKLPIDKDIVSLIKKCKNVGFTIWIVTTRPDIEPVKSDTLFWLKNNKVPFNEVFFVNDKKSFLKNLKCNKNINLILDDELNKLIDFA